jgi:hypothetical protein
MSIDRREAIKKTALMMGGALSAPTILGVLNGCTPSMEPNWAPKFFTKEQAVTVMELAETIIPKTDTPGAKDIGVPKFIEEMVSTIFSLEDRTKFMKGLQAFEAECDDKMGDPFGYIEPNKQLSFTMQKNRDIQKLKGVDFGEEGIEKPFFWTFKELTMLGYFTSEVGATKVLQHKYVPTRYEGCIPLAEAGEGKTWSM